MDIGKRIYRLSRWLLSPLRGFGLRDYAIVRWLLSIMKPRIAYVHGFRINLDRTDESMSHFYIEGIQEPLETRLVYELVRPGNVVLDIGANIGYYTLLLSKLVGSEGKVYAFEPAPETYQLLKKNVRENRGNTLGQIYLNEVAASDHAGIGKLFINEYNKGNNRLYGSEKLRSVPIKLARIDDIVPKHQRIDFIKMDIEGAEVLALRGMQRMIERDKPTIIMEFWPRRFPALGTTASELIATLESLGYIFEDIDEKNAKVQPMKGCDLLKNYSDTIDGGTNIICRIKN